MPLWFTLRKRAGIADVRLHDLHHNFDSHCPERCSAAPLPTVARLLGHRQASMLRHAHVADREVEAAAERIGKVIDSICCRAECRQQ